MEKWRFMHKIKREYYYFFIIITAILGIFQYGIHKICGFTMYPDEFGYWASAASAVGYDWSETASLGSYYSFGYSLLLIPLLKVFKNGVSVYRMAIALNMVFMCVGVVLMWKVTGRLFGEADKARGVLVSGIAVLYPAWIFYMQMTLAEALLIFLFILIIYLYINFISKPGIGRAMLLVLALVYIYCVHMRTAGVIIACLAALIMLGISDPAVRKQMLIMLGIIMVSGIIVFFLKRNVILAVFTNADVGLLSVNDYGSQMWKVRHILSFEGICIFIKEIIAKVFYLGMASCGLFYWAMGWCIKESARLVKNKYKENDPACMVRQWTAFFTLFSVIGQVLISSIYMHGSPQIDSLVYGRYNEFLMPVLIAAGMYQMARSRLVFQFTLLFGILGGIMLFPIMSVIKGQNLEEIRGYFIIGISYLLKEDSFDPASFFRNAWLLGFILMAIIAGIVRVAVKWENTAWLLGVIIILEIYGGIQANTHYTYKVNRICFQDLIISEKIMENARENARVVYIDEGSYEFIDFQQMQMPDIPIHVVKAEEISQVDGLGEFVIVCRDSEFKDSLRQAFNRQVAANTCIVYFNAAD